MRLLCNILALMRCGKPQADFMAHVLGLLQWLPGRVNFTNLAYYGGCAARTYARWFARPFPWARLAVAALCAGHPHPRFPALAVDATHVRKSGDRTWGADWFWNGMAQAAQWGLEVTLVAAVDPEEGGAFPLCARQSPSRDGTEAVDAEPATPVETALALLREVQAAGAGAYLGVRWVVADGGYSHRAFVEGVQALDLHAVGRVRRDFVLRHRYTGPHPRRPGRRRQFDGCFDRHAPARLDCTPWPEEHLDLYHGVLHSRAWQCWLRVVYVLPHGADPTAVEGVLLYSSDTQLAPTRLVRLYRARFQIEFVFRDAKQHLGLHDCQARAQTKLHFHFNLVFATYFWMRLQARAARDRPLDRFSLHHIKRRHHEREMYQRFEAWSAAGRNGVNAEAAGPGIAAEHPWHRAPPLATGPSGP